MTAISDQELVEQFRQGREPAFNEIVLRYQERIYWVVRRFLNDHDDADDVVQDVFIKAARNLRGFRGDSSLYTWLYRIAVNLSLNAIRRKRVADFFRLDDIGDIASHDDIGPDGRVEADEQRQLIESAAQQLPPKQRTVFVLRYYEDLSYEEIAEILHTSVGGLKANFFHAIRKVAEHVKRQHGTR
ncbi:MAG: sigma-70 family RNA polymerase sigma factor [Bacteroidetes bacterium]|jgi:RNA polymerase sigma-70 factor (ECF subfamily)|nr:sigma-70 family RNA polymerase sigma factor [Bacteroidota bacterium]